MQPSELNILVFGVNHPVPSFIHRRLKKLDERGVRLTIPCHDPGDFRDFKNARLIPFRRLSLAAPWLFLTLAFRALLHLSKTIQLWRAFKHKVFFSRLKGCLETLQWINLRDINLIHQQWLTPIDRYELLAIGYSSVPVLVSVRGSQVTVGTSASTGQDKVLGVNFAKAKAIHCVSNDLKMKCMELGADAGKIFVNYNGIDLRKFTPGPAVHSGDSTLRLVSVGSLIWRKGYHFQFMIVKELMARGCRVELTIVGSGVDEVGLRYTAIQLGIGEVVVFAGQLQQDQVLATLQKSQVYLSTSVAEGLPNSVVEAAACGLPIVSFSCEGISEAVLDGQTGFIVPFGSIDLAVDKIMMLSNNGAMRFQMGASGRALMERAFEDDVWVSDMISRYCQLASN